jgi:hypothetical protein
MTLLIFALRAGAQARTIALRSAQRGCLPHFDGTEIPLFEYEKYRLTDREVVESEMCTNVSQLWLSFDQTAFHRRAFLLC